MVKHPACLLYCLIQNFVYGHLSVCIVGKEMESSTLYGNRHHSWNIEQLYLAAMGRSLPEKRTVHKQTHVPDTTGMKQTSNSRRVISGFCDKVAEYCALPGYYVASSGKKLPLLTV